MIDNEFLQKLSARAAALFPAADAARHKLEKELYQLMQTSLGKLRVVTREEFDAQLQVLARAQAQITELEAKVGALEEQLGLHPTRADS